MKLRKITLPHKKIKTSQFPWPNGTATMNIFQEAAAVSISAHHSCAPNWPLQAGRSFLYPFWAHLYARLKFKRGGPLHPWWAMAAWPLKTSGTSWNLKDKLVTMDYYGSHWITMAHVAVLGSWIGRNLVKILVASWKRTPITWYYMICKRSTLTSESY